MSSDAAIGTTSRACVKAVVKDSNVARHEASSNEHGLHVISAEKLADMQQNDPAICQFVWLRLYQRGASTHVFGSTRVYNDKGALCTVVLHQGHQWHRISIVLSGKRSPQGPAVDRSDLHAGAVDPEL